VEVFAKIAKYHYNDFKPDPGRDILYGIVSYELILQEISWHVQF